MVWDVEDEKPVSEISQFRSGLFALAIAHSGKLFALGGGSYGPGGDLSVWSLSEAEEVAFVSFGQFPIEGLAFSPDDTYETKPTPVWRDLGGNEPGFRRPPVGGPHPDEPGLSLRMEARTD